MPKQTPRFRVKIESRLSALGHYPRFARISGEKKVAVTIRPTIHSTIWHLHEQPICTFNLSSRDVYTGDRRLTVISFFFFFLSREHRVAIGSRR